MDDYHKWAKDYISEFKPNPISRCRILREYDAQYDAYDRKKNPDIFKSLNWFCEFYGVDKREVVRHWDCIEKGLPICDEFLDK